MTAKSNVRNNILKLSFFSLPKIIREYRMSSVVDVNELAHYILCFLSFCIYINRPIWSSIWTEAVGTNFCLLNLITVSHFEFEIGFVNGLEVEIYAVVKPFMEQWMDYVKNDMARKEVLRTRTAKMMRSREVSMKKILR